MDLLLLQQADAILSKCGRPKLPGGTSVVCIQKSFLIPMVLQPNQTYTFTKEITGETIWTLRAISSDQTMDAVTGVRMQIQLPSGTFLVGGNGQDVGQFASYGSNRYLMDPELDCEPGAKFNVTLSDVGNLGEALAVNLVMEGCYKYFFKNGQLERPGDVLASRIPKYQGIINENILAPCWRAGAGPATPQGFDDELFTYASQVATLPITGPTFFTSQIPIDAGLDAHVRRFMFAISGDAGATAGTVLARIRAGAGYSLNDEFIDYAKYLSGACWAHDWRVKGSDSIYIDLQLVDTAGAGNIYVQVFAECVRRRRVG